MVVLERLGVLNDAPVNKRVPPVEAEYQYNCPEPVAKSVTTPGPQRETLLADGAEGITSIIACIGVLLALTHPFSVSA